MFYFSSYRHKKSLVVLFSLFSYSIVFGQVDITGPKCVLTTLVYQYDINGNWKENDKVSVCVEGGMLMETGTACVEKQTLSLVKVQWGEGRSTGKISVTSASGTASISVNIASSFNPGFIQNTDKQIFSYNRVLFSLSCGPASGGNCSPSYTYQWELSEDNLRWTEIAGATQLNLSANIPLKRTTFFRRKVFESKSRTVGYSNEITVIVTPEIRVN
jgi:hypothetical protein